MEIAIVCLSLTLCSVTIVACLCIPLLIWKLFQVEQTLQLVKDQQKDLDDAMAEHFAMDPNYQQKGAKANGQ